jgi:hypothetical protein
MIRRDDLANNASTRSTNPKPTSAMAQRDFTKGEQPKQEAVHDPNQTLVPPIRITEIEADTAAIASIAHLARTETMMREPTLRTKNPMIRAVVRHLDALGVVLETRLVVLLAVLQLCWAHISCLIPHLQLFYLTSYRFLGIPRLMPLGDKLRFVDALGQLRLLDRASFTHFEVWASTRFVSPAVKISTKHLWGRFSRHFCNTTLVRSQDRQRLLEDTIVLCLVETTGKRWPKAIGPTSSLSVGD